MADSDISKKDNSAEKALGIFQSEYYEQFEVGRHTDNKASNMLATAGTVTGLLFGFGTFLVSNIKIDYEFISYAIFLLISGIILNISSVFLSILAFKMRRYEQVLVPDPYLKKTGYNESVIKRAENYDIDAIYSLVNTDSPTLTRDLIKTYITCNKINSEINAKKGSKVLYAQWIFIVSLLTIPFLVGILLHAYSSNAIRIG